MFSDTSRITSGACLLEIPFSYRPAVLEMSLGAFLQFL